MQRRSIWVLFLAIASLLAVQALNAVAEPTDADMAAELDRYNNMNIPTDAACDAKMNFYNTEGAADQANAQSEAADTASFSKDKLGGNSQAYDKLAVPLEQKDKDMKNLSDNVAFSATVDCPVSNEFLKITYYIAGTGEINVVLDQDLNLDSAVDKSLTVTDVSGVCINGVVKCPPGTYSVGCSYWAWVEDNTTLPPNGTLAVVQKDFKDMDLCYCTNNSCSPDASTVYPHGTPQYTNKILGDIGVGTTAVINRVKPNYKVTRGSFSGYSVTYSASDPQNCYNDNVTPNFKPDPTTTELTSKVGDGSSDVFLTNPANTETALQRGNENSAMTMMDTTVGESGGEFKVCERRMSATATPQRTSWCNLGTTYKRGDWGVGGGEGDEQYDATMTCRDTNGDGYGDTIDLVIGISGPTLTRYTTTILLPAQTVSKWLWMNPPANTYTFYCDWYGSDGPVWSRVKTLFVPSCPTALPCTYDLQYTNIDHYGGSGKVSFTNQGILTDFITMSMTVDTCSALESNPDCMLYDEKVNDSEWTYRSGVKQLTMLDNTGNTVAYQHKETCQQPSGAANYHQICERDSRGGFEDIGTGNFYVMPGGYPAHWKVARTYQCKSTASCDNVSWGPDCLKDEAARADNVVDSTNESGNQFTFSDMGNKTNPGYTDGGTYIQAPNMGSDNCVMSCDVKKIASVHTTTEYSDQQNRANATSSSGASLRSVNQPEKSIRPCERQGGPLNQTNTYLCPFDPTTEQVIQYQGKDCTCRPQDFSEGVAGVQLLEDIAKDFMCAQ